ncbi:MAG: MraY family glycosyltransferase [Stellaceae bacterium]
MIAVAASVAAGVGTRALIPVLRRRKVLDHPNARSSHAAATPRGGGLAPVGVVLCLWAALIFAGSVRPAVWAVVLGAVLLAAISWLDDVRSLSPVLRLSVHAAAVAVGLFALPAPPNPPLLYYAAYGLLWVWWLNLFNFMDGIDGIAGSEAAAIGGGLWLFAAIGRGVDLPMALLAAGIVGAALGFLGSNWAPARVFLGDVGSTGLGYLSGFLLLDLAGRGHWLIALILPLYFLADATITLGRRLWRGERVWQAHHEHFYQMAVRRGRAHAAIVRRVIAADLVLILLGWTAENGWPALSLGLACITVAALLFVLAKGL